MTENELEILLAVIERAAERGAIYQDTKKAAEELLKREFGK